MKKKILINLAIICIIFGGAFNAYAQVSLFSGSRVQLSVYADDDTPIWEPVNQNDLVTAFRYYCKSRNVIIEGSLADAITTFTTTTFNGICNTLGIDLTLLQAELKKTYDNNLGQRFLFTHSGISLYNRIFAEFLQNNELNVGDSVDNEIIRSGELFTDNNGYSCFVYVVNSTDSSYSDKSKESYGLQIGSIYHFDSFSNFVSTYKSDIEKYYTLGVSAGSTNYTYYFHNTFNSSSAGKLYTINNKREGSSSYSFEYYKNVRGYDYLASEGWPCIWKDSNGYYFGAYGEYPGSDYSKFRGIKFQKITNPNSRSTTITVNTPDGTVINNYDYSKNYTIIYNDGDYYEDDDDDEPSPSTPPGGGGGGGDDPDPDQPPVVDPTPTPEPHIPDWDIELPGMPEGSEWLLYGMEKKFPWDIPYNLMFMLSLFAAEPETPHFEGTIDLKICEWNYDIDLAPFDNIARYVRDFEFIGFLIGLMLITRKLIWG